MSARSILTHFQIFYIPNAHTIAPIDRLGRYLKSDFWIPGISQKMGLRQVEQGFSLFFAKFLVYLIIFRIKHSVLI